MIGIGYDCDYCRNKLPLKDGWKTCCKAFPDGIPFEYYKIYPSDLAECNNGIGYDPVEGGNPFASLRRKPKEGNHGADT